MGHGGRSYRRLFRKGTFIVYNGGDRGCAPDPAAFFVGIDLSEAFIAHRPAVHGGAAGGAGGQKNFEYSV
jgi:hypothetical protein